MAAPPPSASLSISEANEAEVAPASNESSSEQQQEQEKSPVGDAANASSPPRPDTTSATAEEGAISITVPPPSSPPTPAPVAAPVTPSPPRPPSLTSWTRGSGRRILVGICAREKKVKSKAMTEILSRFDSKKFEVFLFGDKCILNDPPEQWPYCDALIAFYSTGFPSDKAEHYAEIHKPFILNDLPMQRVLHDRRRVYTLLMENNIDVPNHAFLNRDDPNAESQALEEYDEYIVVNGVQINKPLVEKPADAEDHNVYIYYPLSMGGGSKRLFRKVGDRSSEFYPDINEVRRNGSYIYEEFVETQGTDVKVYTIGPDYGHAEARKSPVVDGKVNRNENGKEIRYPVILSAAEKEIARKVCLAFKQTVCGFDLLRVQGRSFVCDVNGWSFVKNNRKYYDDCAQLLSEFISAALEPGKISGLSAIGPLLKRGSGPGRLGSKSRQRPSISATTVTGPAADSSRRLVVTPPVTSITSPRGQSGRTSRNGSPDGKERHPLEHKEELRCVIAVIRHGDRTPKQKMKMMTSYEGYLKFYADYTDDCRKDVKIKTKHQLLAFLAHTKTYISKLQEGMSQSGSYVGGLGAGHDKVEPDMELLYKLHQIRDVLERSKIAGFNRKLQLKPRKFEQVTVQSKAAGPDGETVEEKQVDRCIELMLILKWGGDLTKLGERQAERLGERFTQAMYPDPSGGGILRLHSTFRHDMKIKASDEGRVMKTAAAFTKGMLELEGELTPILVSLVHREKETIHMLDPSGNAEIKKELEECKHHLHQMMQQDIDLTDEQIDQIVPVGQTSIKSALSAVRNPRKALFKIRELSNLLAVQLDELVKSQGLVTEPLSRTGSGTTLASFISATAFADTNCASARGPSPSNLDQSAFGVGSTADITRGISTSEIGGGAVNKHMGLSYNSAGSTSACWSDIKSAPSGVDIAQAMVEQPKDQTSLPPRHPAHPSPATETDPTSVSSGKDKDGRSRRESSMTDYDQIYFNRPDETMDTRSEGGYESAEAYWRGAGGSDAGTEGPGDTGSRSNSVTLGLADQVSGLSTDTPRKLEPHGGETLILMLDRWKKLHKDLYNAKTDSFDLSKVPDVHDNIRYDMLHNWHLHLRGMDELAEVAKNFADCTVPQEYGVDKEEKRILGSHMCQALLEKIKYDLIIARGNESFDVRYNLDVAHAADLPINSLGRRVRTRLYFTSESHLHSLLNVMRFPEENKECCFTEEARRVIDNTPELCYLTHIVLRMFEDLDKHEDDPTRFRIEILFSPGVTAEPSPVAASLAEHVHLKHIECQRWHLMHPGLTWDELNNCIDNAMKIGRQKPSLQLNKPAKSRSARGSIVAGNAAAGGDKGNGGTQPPPNVEGGAAAAAVGVPSPHPSASSVTTPGGAGASEGGGLEPLHYCNGSTISIKEEDALSLVTPPATPHSSSGEGTGGFTHGGQQQQQQGGGGGGGRDDPSYGLFLEQGMITGEARDHEAFVSSSSSTHTCSNNNNKNNNNNNNHHDTPRGSISPDPFEGIIASKLAGDGGMTPDTSRADTPVPGSDEAFPGGGDSLSRSRAGSFTLSQQSSAILSAAVVAAASIVGGVMLLRKDRA